MKVQPRQQLLEIWEATLRNSWDDGRWVTGGRFESNVIADAEQLLCLLLPATKVPAFNLDRPDQTGERMVQALRKIGTATDIPRTLTRILTDYFFLRYTDETGTPTFAGAGYFDLEDEGAQASAEQREIPIVDAFAVSVTLSLATLGFVRVFSRSVTREDVRAQLRVLEELASTRLSAAMVSLLRSFAVHVFPVDSPEGRSLCDMANQSRMPRRTVVSQLQRELRETAASFREVLIGSGQTPDLEQPDRLFECGWSWSVVDKRRTSRPARRSASSRTAWPRTSPTSTSRSSRSTRWRTCSPSAPGPRPAQRGAAASLPGAPAAVGPDPHLLGEGRDVR